VSELAKIILFFTIFFGSFASAHEEWKATEYSRETAHRPTPLPDRVVLTWEDDPATTQSVTWRTDVSSKKGFAHLAIANSNGRELEPEVFEAETMRFESDINEAHYHSVKFSDLKPNTLYAYRVGDGVNWTEYYHFKTASDQAKPFSFIYFGDAQNEVRTHWSRVFREAFRDAPRAAFTLHAGDLIDNNDWDVEWGDWHQGPDWVNGTIPVIATPGNHEYRRLDQGSRSERFWATSEGRVIEVEMTSFKPAQSENGTTYELSFVGPKGNKALAKINDGGNIVIVDDGMQAITGFTKEQLLGSSFYAAPLYDRQRNPGIPAVSTHWRPQFAFPIQGVPDESLKETVYYIDYQGVRFISLDSNKAPELQVPWFREVLSANPNKWTIVTFHHPVFSPGSDRDNPKIRELWKPVIDEFKVDLVLSGHDHTYARTGQIDTKGLVNVPSGYQQAYDPKIGTVYVVSVSGPKMYPITKGNYAKRVAENTQLYQIINIDGENLEYRAFEATGELYDSFTLQKRKGSPNLLVETLP
jgi:3',5'-cyclic AMP phosphodiesterase CpdA